MAIINLWEKGKTPYYNAEYGQPETSLIPYIVPEQKDENGNVKKTGCVIVCTGGGYTHLGPRESDPMAELINEAGISAFVLNYRFGPYKAPAIISDVQRAVRWVRYHAEEFNIDPEKIACMGFSAGGHLSSMAATLFDYGRDDGDEIDRISCRPNAAILCYAVTTMNLDYGDDYSRSVFIGGAENEDALEKLYSAHLNVKDDTPPMFIWHTAADPIVPVENALQMSTALSAKKIPFELHVFPDGAHGLARAEDIPGTCQWSDLLKNWLQRQGF